MLRGVFRDSTNQTWGKHGGFNWTRQGLFYILFQQDLDTLRLFLILCPPKENELESYKFTSTGLMPFLRTVSIQETP